MRSKYLCWMFMLIFLTLTAASFQNVYATEPPYLSNNSTVKNILNAFINDVEAQAGKHLTSEAYALLKFNLCG